LLKSSAQSYAVFKTFEDRFAGRQAGWRAGRLEADWRGNPADRAQANGYAGLKPH
jgi:hypothetical protein